VKFLPPSATKGTAAESSSTGELVKSCSMRPSYLCPTLSHHSMRLGTRIKRCRQKDQRKSIFSIGHDTLHPSRAREWLPALLRHRPGSNSRLLASVAGNSVASKPVNDEDAVEYGVKGWLNDTTKVDHSHVERLLHKHRITTSEIMTVARHVSNTSVRFRSIHNWMEHW
jgi:hypothetical protein